MFSGLHVSNTSPGRGVNDPLGMPSSRSDLDLSQITCIKEIVKNSFKSQALYPPSSSKYDFSLHSSIDENQGLSEKDQFSNYINSIKRFLEKTIEEDLFVEKEFDKLYLELFNGILKVESSFKLKELDKNLKKVVKIFLKYVEHACSDFEKLRHGSLDNTKYKENKENLQQKKEELFEYLWLKLNELISKRPIFQSLKKGLNEEAEERGALALEFLESLVDPSEEVKKKLEKLTIDFSRDLFVESCGFPELSENSSENDFKDCVEKSVALFFEKLSDFGKQGRSIIAKEKEILKEKLKYLFEENIEEVEEEELFYSPFGEKEESFENALLGKSNTTPSFIETPNTVISNSFSPFVRVSTSPSKVIFTKDEINTDPENNLKNPLATYVNLDDYTDTSEEDLVKNFRVFMKKPKLSAEKALNYKRAMNELEENYQEKKRLEELQKVMQEWLETFAPGMIQEEDDI